MKFIINGQIYFDSDTASLSPVGGNDELVQISNPAKRLLLLLIYHQGEAVSREVIFKKVWDDFGMVSSNNNLNQCISKLRRVLKNLGAEEEVISTVPKLGFMLLQQIPVMELSEENPPDEQLPSEAEVNEPDLTSQEIPVKTEAPQTSSGSANGKKALLQRLKASCRLSRNWSWMILSLSLILLGIAATLVWSPVPAERTEIYVGIAGGCKVLMSQDIMADRDQTELKAGVMNYARRLAPQCGSNEYMLVIKSSSIKPWINDLTRLYFMRCGYLRESKAEVCWSLNEPANYAPLS
ncbi:winged helix-turn-helix domain-containing protein [Pantoea sp. BAV 3049]|uniref:winged helix-turn-helix domain-containing protein n=1 Tax=Pantoea sp. BAV 3049 TaxID=2654188 RepID=UPI00131DA70C|nr:winged helix-turn-helix domain-containing protein [Pantoea sp. BAV 3049]